MVRKSYLSREDLEVMEGLTADTIKALKKKYGSMWKIAVKRGRK